MAKLTNKQSRFIEEYLVDLNATQAAIRAGYSEKTAMEQGYQLLQKTSVQECIQKRMDGRSKRTEITSDRILEEIAKIGFSDVRNILTETDHLRRVSSLPDDVAACVQSIEVVTRQTGQTDADGNKEVEYVHKIRLADKLKGLELLGKHLVLFTEKHVHIVEEPPRTAKELLARRKELDEELAILLPHLNSET